MALLNQRKEDGNILQYIFVDNVLGKESIYVFFLEYKEEFSRNRINRSKKQKLAFDTFNN